MTNVKASRNHNSTTIEMCDATTVTKWGSTYCWRDERTDTVRQALYRLFNAVHVSRGKSLNTLTRPLLSYGYHSYKASCARRDKAVICKFWHPGTLALRAER